MIDARVVLYYVVRTLEASYSDVLVLVLVQLDRSRSRLSRCYIIYIIGYDNNDSIIEVPW